MKGVRTMPHECKQCEVIQQLKVDVAVAQSDIKTVRLDIVGIKDSISKVHWWLMGIMGTTIVTLATILLKT